MAEDVTLGLGGILGESTNLRPLNDRPFTKAAQAELTLGLKAKADEAKLAAEKAKIEKEYANIIKPPANVDKIGADRIKQLTINGLMSGAFKTQMGAMLGQQEMNREQEYSDQYREIKKSADDILLTPDEKTALKNDDYTAMKKFSENPNSNIGWDKESGRPFVKKILPDVDLNAEYKKYLTFGNDVKLDDTKTKIVYDVNGHASTVKKIAPEVVDMKIDALFSNPNFAPNYLHKNREKVAVELPAELAKVDVSNPEAVAKATSLAIKSAVRKELDPMFYKQVDIKDKPKKSSGLNFNFGSGGTIGSNGIEMKPDPNDKGLINIKKTVQPGKDPEVLSAILLDKNGQPHNFGKIEAYRKIGKDNYRVIGSTTESGTAIAKSIANISGEQLAKSVGMSKDALEQFPVSFEYDKEVEARNKRFEIYFKKHPTTNGKPTTQESLYGDIDVTRYIAYNPNSAAKPKAAATPATTTKMSYPEWKKSNPNGSPTDYKKYKG